MDRLAIILRSCRFRHYRLISFEKAWYGRVVVLLRLLARKMNASAVHMCSLIPLVTIDYS